MMHAGTRLPAKLLEVEITESGIITDQQHALQLVRALKAIGVTVAMDDFGTGYSSLSTLQQFPFDKIRSTLVSSRASDPNPIPPP